MAASKDENKTVEAKVVESEGRAIPEDVDVVQMVSLRADGKADQTPGYVTIDDEA